MSLNNRIYFRPQNELYFIYTYRADDLPERLDERPLVLFALRRECAFVAAKSVVQPPLVGGMHVT